MIIRGSEFVPAPEGVHNAVCVDVVDLGIVDGAFGKKHAIKIVWEIDARMDDGKRFIVQRRYTVSLHEKSSLAKDLKSWRGRPFTADELKGFDMEKVVNAPCQLVIQHAEKEGGVFANIQSVVKAGPTKIAPSGNYTRIKDRPPQQQNGKSQTMTNSHTQEEETIPF